MILRKLYSLDDMTTNLPAVINSNNTANLSGWNTPTSGASWDAIQVVNIGGRKWAKGVNNLNCISVPLNALGLTWTGKVVIAFRMVSNTPGNSRTGSFHNGAFSSAFYDTVGGGTANNPLLQPNQEHYVESVLDIENRIYSRYVDGRQQANTIISSWTLAQFNAILSTYYNHLLGAYTGSTDNWWIRDIHVREYAPGEAFTSFSTVDIARVALSQAASADYATSDGSVLVSPLNTDFTDLSTNPNGSLIVPFVEAQKGATAAPLVLTLNGYDGVEGTPIGLDIVHTMKTMDGVPAALTPKWTQGGLDMTLPKQVLPAAYVYRKSLGAVSVAPDTGAITRAKLTGSTLTLTASTS